MEFLLALVPECALGSGADSERFMTVPAVLGLRFRTFDLELRRAVVTPLGISFLGLTIDCRGSSAPFIDVFDPFSWSFRYLSMESYRYNIRYSNTINKFSSVVCF